MVLGDKDANAAMDHQQQQQQHKCVDGGDKNKTGEAAHGKHVKSMDYHRQMLHSKMAEEPSKQYVSPSDNIMSPCTAKINALRNKQVGKAKPKSLFAQASAKKLGGENPFGNSKSIPDS